MRRRAVLALLLWAAAVAVGVRSWRTVQRGRSATVLCDGVAAGRFEEALAAPPLDASDAAGRRAAGCRTEALVKVGRPEEALRWLDGLVRDPGSGAWMPEPPLAAALISAARLRGDLAGAATLARRAVRAYPHEGPLLVAELDARSAVEPEPEVLREMASRLPEMGEAARALRIILARRWYERGETAQAAALLDEAPPAALDPVANEWYLLRGEVFGAAGDPRGLDTMNRRWLAAGGDSAEVLARHALVMSVFGLRDARYPALPLLRKALEQEDALRDPALVESLYLRLVGTLVASGRAEEALRWFDRGRQRFDLASFDRAEIAAAAARGAEGAPRIGSVRFTFSDAPPGGTLWVAPPAEGGVDSAFEPHAVAGDAAVTVHREAGDTFPLLWSWRGAQEERLAAGSAWPLAGGVATVEVQAAAAPTPPRRSTFGGRLRPDGRRRVLAVVLDCGDWRLVQYGRARGELPFFDRLVGEGTRAVLDSDPPFTAVAMESLAFPGRRAAGSLLGLVHQLGDELAGLNFVGDNPFAALGWFVPATPGLIATVGATERVALNLLFSKGGVQAGRHGEQVGPNGHVDTFSEWSSGRPLSADERAAARLPEGLARQEEGWFEEAAADLDAAAAVVEAGTVDLLLLRVAPLDLMTHRDFASLRRGGAEDGPLLALYRYLDLRLDALDAALDGDDLLIVLSDHGIRSAAEHDRRCLFVALGEGIGAGRVAGTPDLRGVPWLLAALLGVETPWPPSGLEAVLRAAGPPPGGTARPSP